MEHRKGRKVKRGRRVTKTGEERRFFLTRLVEPSLNHRLRCAKDRPARGRSALSPAEEEKKKKKKKKKNKKNVLT